MKKRPNVLVIGSSNTDLTIKSDKLPKPAQTVLGKEFFIASGGKGANQAVAAARAGADVTFIAKIGDDIFGNNNIKTYKEDGINTNHIIIDNGNHSGIALIMVDEDGENLISVASNSNFNFKPNEIEEKKEVIKSADIILLQNEIPPITNEKIIDLAHELNKPVLLNPAPGPKNPSNSELIKKINYLTPNKNELELVSGEIITNDLDIENIGTNLVKKGLKTLIITLGSKGSMLIDSNQINHIPAYQVKAVDTVAAGDCFNGYLGAMIASRKNIIESIKIASAAAAISVTRRGAQPSIPKIHEVLEFIQKNK
jgi:ribokinase